MFRSIINFSFLILCTVAAVNMMSASLSAAEKTLQENPQIATLMVNINNASAEEIADVMTGIGLKKALTIVEYREKTGAFRTIDDLLSVKGIGPATLEKNRHKLKL